MGCVIYSGCCCVQFSSKLNLSQIHCCSQEFKMPVDSATKSLTQFLTSQFLTNIPMQMDMYRNVGYIHVDHNVARALCFKMYAIDKSRSLWCWLKWWHCWRLYGKGNMISLTSFYFRDTSIDARQMMTLLVIICH